MNTYEIFCHNHSQIIQAESLALAVVQFNVENPNEDAIFAENVEYRRLNESAPVDDVVDLWEENALLKKEFEDLKAEYRFLVNAINSL